MSGATLLPATWALSPSTSGACARKSSAIPPTQCFCKRSGAWAISWDDPPEFQIANCILHIVLLNMQFTICNLQCEDANRNSAAPLAGAIWSGCADRVWHRAAAGDRLAGRARRRHDRVGALPAGVQRDLAGLRRAWVGLVPARAGAPVGAGHADVHAWAGGGDPKYLPDR